MTDRDADRVWLLRETARYLRMVGHPTVSDTVRAAADEIERLRAALVRYGDALDDLSWPVEGVDTIHTMAERARRTINSEPFPPVKPSVKETL